MTDDHLQQPREARDHRVIVAKQWRERHPQPEFTSDQRFKQIADDTQKKPIDTPQLAHETLKTLLWLAADVAPIPLTIMLFAKGIVGIHHLYRVHKFARGAGGSDDAREIIAEVTEQVTKLPVEQTRETIDSIMSHFREEGA